MAQASWEKTVNGGAQASGVATPKGERLKFMAGGVLIIGAIILLIATGMSQGARFFITVNEVVGEARCRCASLARCWAIPSSMTRTR